MNARNIMLAAIGLTGLLATAIPAHAKMDIDYRELAKRESQNTQVAHQQPAQHNTVIAQVAPVTR